MVLFRLVNVFKLFDLPLDYDSTYITLKILEILTFNVHKNTWSTLSLSILELR